MQVKFRHFTLGVHVHTMVYAGPDSDHLKHSGNLVFGADEFEQFKKHMSLAEFIDGVVRVEFEEFKRVIDTKKPEDLPPL
jgi:hypothetical protein